MTELFDFTPPPYTPPAIVSEHTPVSADREYCTETLMVVYGRAAGLTMWYFAFGKGCTFLASDWTFHPIDDWDGQPAK